MRFRPGALKTPRLMRCQKRFSVTRGLALLLLSIGLSPVARAAPMDDLPMLGDASSGIVSREMEARIGEDFMRQIRAQLPTHTDPLIIYWMEQLLFDLAAASDLRDPSLHLVMVDSGQINAFAAPGGIVGINLGNFVAGQSVHEFAAIVAHELAHLSQRHFARGVEAQRAMTLPYVAAMIASAAIMATVGADAGIAAMASSQAAMQDSMLRYSRAREREADRVGIETLHRAGMDPWAMAGMFERMSRAARYSRRPPEFLLTHPVTETRIADARDRANQYPRQTFPDTLDYQLMRARVQLHLAESPRDMATTFRVQLEEGRTGFPDAARYGLALAQLRQGQLDEAAATLAPLLEAEPHRIAYAMAEVDINLERGRPDQAIASLERKLQLYPGNVPLTMAYARSLNRAQRHLEAQTVLERLAVRRPADAQVWYELAETAGLAGDIVAVHRARAEYFQLHGNLQHALQHLQYALQLVTDNFPLTARLNQRVQDIREIRQRIAG
ncbi:MAG: M48 family metallopeptidase [Gammaproteobacteria bacterium]|nr:M48 family metallopeptidase [Gammaproteobacteria bacterium]